MESASIDANGAILLAHRSATSATLDGLQFGHLGLECVLQWDRVAIAFRLAVFNLAKLCHCLVSRFEFTCESGTD